MLNLQVEYKEGEEQDLLRLNHLPIQARVGRDWSLSAAYEANGDAVWRDSKLHSIHDSVELGDAPCSSQALQPPPSRQGVSFSFTFPYHL